MKKIIYSLFFIISLQTLPANLNVIEDNAVLKGYCLSKLDDRFPNEKIEIDVQSYTIIVYDFPAELCDEIRQYLKKFTEYDIVFDHSYRPNQDLEPNLHAEAIIEEGNLLPELSPFFPTMLAQPHIVGYSAGYRGYDKTFKTRVLPASIGDQFSLYQFKIDPHGRLYLGMEACVWAIFEAKTKSLALINADYYVALPLTYINNRFAMRLRVYHESSHLGDEFILENRRIERLNPSMEVVDLSLAYQVNDCLTPFIGFSRVLRSDDSYKIQPNGIFYGFNYFLNFWKLRICNLEATPYMAVFFANSEDNKWQLDSSAVVGYQWDKMYGHKLRIYIEGHKGYSAEGQFSKKKTSYAAFKIFYGY